jgi:hypothetical protein
MRVCTMCLSHIVYNQNVSIAIATTFRVTTKNIRHKDNLSNRKSEQLDVIKFYTVTGYERLSSFNIR